jgi:DivIVA domain-containing protein
MVLFLFLVIALVVVVAAVTLAVVGGGDNAALPEAPPERLADPLPPDRPVGRADVESLRFPVTVRGYRMADVDDALGRLGAELAERDARIEELETALAGSRTRSAGGFAEPSNGFAEPSGGFAGPDGFAEPSGGFARPGGRAGSGGPGLSEPYGSGPDPYGAKAPEETPGRPTPEDDR